MENSGGSNIWDVISSLVWPGVLAAVFFSYRAQISNVITTLARKFEDAAEIKLGNIELKGPILDPTSAQVSIEGNDYLREAATDDDLKQRNKIYNNTRSLMLVHRIRPSEKEGQEFEISVFLARKTSKNSDTARFNEINRVEYYFGKYFGEKPNGSKFVVKTPDDGFAVSTSAYGSPLCVAKIYFNDGNTAETYRYLDFEMETAFGDRKVY